MKVVKNAKFVLILLTLLLTQTIAFSAGEPINVTNCTIIKNPGVYVLTKDITNSTSSICIDIQSGDVIFDGQGFKIDGIGSGDGIKVYNYSITLPNVTIKNVTLNEWNNGVKVYNSENASLIDLTITNGTIGVEIDLASNLTIVNSLLKDNTLGGIILSDSENIVISRNTIQNNGEGPWTYSGIQVSGSNNVTVSDNYLYGNGYRGIYINSNNVTISNNSILNSYDDGVLVSGMNVTLKNNTVKFSGGNGYTVWTNATIESCISESNSGYGIRIDGQNATILNCTILNNEDDGIYVYSNNITLENNTILENDVGISIFSSEYITVRNCSILNNNQGIQIFSSSNIDFVSNNISGNEGNGFYIDGSEGVFISSNVIENGGNIYLTNLKNSTFQNNVIKDSITLWKSSGNEFIDNSFIGCEVYIGSSNNTVDGNKFQNSEYAGLSIQSSNNTIINNVFVNSGATITKGDNIVINNSVNGKPLVYLDEVQNHVVSDAGQVIAINCSNITVKNLEISNTYAAIEFYNTNSSLIEGNLLHGNRYGVYLWSSTDNVIRNNNIYNNTWGISFTHSSINNTIYNNIFNNTQNVDSSYYPLQTNFWSVAKTYATNILGGSYIGGNAWLTPYKTGFSQLAPDNDGDGICDYPYQLDQNNIDFLPLKAMGNLSNPPIQTILMLEAVSSPPNSTATLVDLKVSSNERIAGINLTISYDANAAEMVEIRSNSTIYSSIDNTDGTARILLTNTNGINAIEQATLLTLKFRVNASTNTFIHLNITNAELSDVDGEAFKPDVILNGSITVTIRGDFNGNERVDIGDVVKVAYMVIGTSDEDLAADFNRDGDVDIADLAKLAYYVLGEINEL
jgi:parallel beta-helix repeat protein